MSEKIALVTGASAGIGKSICQHLLEDGYVVLNLSRRGSESSHERLIDHPVDLADVEATKEAIAELAGKYDITTLVHNAGVIRPNLIEDVQLEDLQYLTNLHLSASIVLTQGVLDAMKRAGFGRIVIIGSRAMLGLETRTSYSATKAAQIGLVRTWAMELGQYGITVNAVAPGATATERTPGPEHPHIQAVCKRIPLGRFGLAAEIGAVVAFLASPEAAYITGQIIYVDGGITAQLSPKGQPV